LTCGLSLAKDVHKLRVLLLLLLLLLLETKLLYDVLA